MGLFSKTKTIPASATYRALEGTLPQASDVYGQLSGLTTEDLVAGLTAPQTTAINQLALGTSGYSDPFSGDLFQSYLDKYQNPYQEQVIDPTLATIREQSDIARSRLGEEATSAGGFGGTRQALENALLEGETQKNLANTEANLRSQGLSSAMDRAMQDYLSGQNVYQQGLQNQLTAGGMLQGQTQSELDAANQLITQPLEWYQNYLTSMPSNMITPEQKVKVGTGLSKALGAVSTLGGIGSGVAGMLGSGGLSSLFGASGGLGSLFGGGSSSPFGSNAPIPQFKPVQYG